MRNLSITLILVLLSCIGALSISCSIVPPNKTISKILKIKITDRTDLHYYMNGKTIADTVISDPNTIAVFQRQFNSMKELQTIHVKPSFGSYEIIIYFSNNTTKDLEVIYTVYDGVTIYDFSANKAYKNDDLEAFVKPYFYYRSHK